MSRLLVKRIAVVFLVFMALLALALPAQSVSIAAPIATKEPKTVRDEVDVKINGVIANIIAFQAGEAGKSGKFYQVLWSHSQPPADGNLTAPDSIDSFPTDQPGKSARAQWGAAILPASLEARMRVDVYDGPQGKGFVIVVQSQLNGATWQRSINYGPETYRDQGWTELKPLTP